jgi:hypothetical protein
VAMVVPFLVFALVIALMRPRFSSTEAGPFLRDATPRS